MTTAASAWGLVAVDGAWAAAGAGEVPVGVPAVPKVPSTAEQPAPIASAPSNVVVPSARRVVVRHATIAATLRVGANAFR
ncbi:MAG: hypothetical protein R2715_16005 [Ilumatobacteraceae bacterium]